SLEALYRGGIISEEQYRRQAALLVEEGLNPGAEAPDPATVALYKSVSAQPLTIVANALIGYFWTGQLVAAGILALLQVAASPARQFIHDLSVEAAGGSSPRDDSARVIDFVYM